MLKRAGTVSTPTRGKAMTDKQAEWVLVPREPTREMAKAACEAFESVKGWAGVVGAAIDAAPPYQPKAESVEAAMVAAVAAAPNFADLRFLEKNHPWMRAALTAAYPELLARIGALEENLQGCLEALSSHAPDCIEVSCARELLAEADRKEAGK